MSKRRSIINEFLDFVVENKAYWIAPIIIVLLLFGILILIGGSSVAPFIYTLF